MIKVHLQKGSDYLGLIIYSYGHLIQIPPQLGISAAIDPLELFTRLIKRGIIWEINIDEMFNDEWAYLHGLQMVNFIVKLQWTLNNRRALKVFGRDYRANSKEEMVNLLHAIADEIMQKKGDIIILNYSEAGMVIDQIKS